MIQSKIRSTEEVEDHNKKQPNLYNKCIQVLLKTNVRKGRAIQKSAVIL